MMGSTEFAENYSLRRASAVDATMIRQIIARVGNNPMALDWQRFTLAIDQEGKVIGCGQVKPHQDGTCELASIAVLPEWRGRGVARRIIEHLLSENPARLYLTCRDELGPMYAKFGFEVVEYAQMPPYFKRISRLVRLFNRLSHRSHRLLVMRRN